MPTSTRAKGRAFETWCRDRLVEQGWAVHLCGRKAMMIGPGRLITAGNDIFGSDLVAIKPGQRTLFVQATMDSSVKKRLDETLSYPWDLKYQQVQLWQKKADGSVIVQLYTGAGFAEVGRFIRGKFYLKGGAS